MAWWAFYKLLESGIGGKVYEPIKSLYTENKCAVKIGSKRTEFFKQGRGVRQGCSLSPTLFNIYINELAMMLKQSAAPGLTLHDSNIKFLLYADDLVLLSPTEEGTEAKFGAWFRNQNLKTGIKLPLKNYNWNSVKDSKSSPKHPKQCMQSKKGQLHFGSI